MASKKLSHGTRYYRAHPERERDRKRTEKARWDGFFKAYRDRNPDARFTLREFKREVRSLSPDGRAHLPSHSARRVGPRELEAQRQTSMRFLGLDYTREEFEDLYGE